MFSRKEMTQLFSVSSERETTLLLGMKQMFSRIRSVPFGIIYMYCVNFMFITSRATDTGLLVKRALTSKSTKVLSGATFCSLRDSSDPLLSLTNEKLLLQYH